MRHEPEDIISNESSRTTTSIYTIKDTFQQLDFAHFIPLGPGLSSLKFEFDRLIHTPAACLLV